MDDIEARVKKVLARHFDIDVQDISTSGGLEALGADSLDYFEILSELEEEFRIDIPDDDLPELITVQQVIDLVKGKVSA